MAKSEDTTYEGMFLLPVGATVDVDGSISLVRSLIERHGGEILVIKKWDERKLAYEIEKQKRGLYIIAFFKAPGTTVAAIEREVGLTDTVLRVMILRAEELTQAEMEAVEPQPIERRPEGFGDRF